MTAPIYTCTAAKLFENGPVRWTSGDLHRQIDASRDLVVGCLASCRDAEKRAVMLARIEDSTARQHAEVDNPSLIDWPAWIESQALVFAMVEMAHARRAARR